MAEVIGPIELAIRSYREVLCGVELHHFRCAIAIADHGSFTAAASALHLTQPSLSYAVARLEAELGTRLFERTSAGATPTAAGAAFLPPARRALTEADDVAAAVQAVTGLLTGSLQIVSIRTAVVETGAWAAQFHRRYPGVRLSLREPAGDREVAEDVRTGRADVGIMRASEVPTDLDTVVVAAQDLVVLFPTDLAPAAKTIRLSDLAGIPLVVPVQGAVIRAAHDELLRGHGVEPAVAAECDHLETTIELVRNGAGAAITSTSRAGTIQGGGLRALRVRPRIQMQLSAVLRPGSAAPAAQSFIAELMPHASTE